MAVSFSDLNLAFEFVSSGGMGENEAYLDPQSGKIYWHGHRRRKLIARSRTVTLRIIPFLMHFLLAGIRCDFFLSFPVRQGILRASAAQPAAS